MAISCAAIGSAYKGATATSHTNGGGATTTGSTFVAVVICSGGAPSSVSDSKSNTYTLVRTQQVASFGDKYDSMYYCENGTGGAGHTFTSNHGATTVATILFVELTGASATSFDGATDASSNDDASNPRTLATAASVAVDDLVVMSCGSSNSGTETFTANDGYTIAQSTTDGTTGKGAAAIIYKVVTSGGVQTGSIDQGGSDAELIIAGFLAGAGGGPALELMGQCCT